MKYIAEGKVAWLPWDLLEAFTTGRAPEAHSGLMSDSIDLMSPGGCCS